MARAHPSVDPDRIVVHGGSQGGGISPSLTRESTSALERSRGRLFGPPGRPAADVARSRLIRPGRGRRWRTGREPEYVTADRTPERIPPAPTGVNSRHKEAC
ncbi:hypothetical protein [Streptomyces sp. NPDC048496]|uniref:hypothetical protein n=1 Tax=Streptomyces sp. NPDC048496 TaxID=3365558 RepID=UPI0037132997